MQILIPNDILGTEASLLIKEDGTYEAFDKEKHGNDFMNIKSRKTFEKASLYGLQIPTFPPDKFKKPYETLLKKGYKIPWVKCIPREIYKNELKKYVKQVYETFTTTDFSYYDSYFESGDYIFKDLSPAAIDLEKFNSYLTEDLAPSLRTGLTSFTPIRQIDDNRFTDLVRYSRLKSRTGRLVVVEGPNILNLKTEFRNILTSSYENGSVYYLDFKSLEPRVLLARKYPNEVLPHDIYQYTLGKLGLEGKVDREHVKVALISIINGAGEREVVRQLSGKVDYPDVFIAAVKEYFGIEELREELLDKYQKNGAKCIYNIYGRPILCENTPPYVLLNYYIQSSAVDVALLGFSKLWSKVVKKELNKFCRPLFVLHDALILDVHPDLEKHLDKVANFGTRVPNFPNTNFWIEASKLT